MGLLQQALNNSHGLDSVVSPAVGPDLVGELLGGRTTADDGLDLALEVLFLQGSSRSPSCPPGWGSSGWRWQGSGRPRTWPSRPGSDGDVTAHVEQCQAGTGQHGLHDVLSDIMHIALNNSDDDLSRNSVGVNLQLGQGDIQGLVHGLSGQKDLGQEVLLALVLWPTTPIALLKLSKMITLGSIPASLLCKGLGFLDLPSLRHQLTCQISRCSYFDSLSNDKEFEFGYGCLCIKIFYGWMDHPCLTPVKISSLTKVFLKRLLQCCIEKGRP